MEKLTRKVALEPTFLALTGKKDRWQAPVNLQTLPGSKEIPMTQLTTISGGNPQAPRSNSRPAMKFILAVAIVLACVLMLMPGTSEAKGGGGGRSSHSGRSAHSGRTNRQGNMHKHHPVQKHKHKHKHKKKKDNDMDGGDGGGGDEGGDEGGGGDSGGSDGGSAAEGAQAAGAGEAVAAQPVVYGMEVTALYKGAAAKAGVEIGDIILKVNGTPTPTFEALAQALARAGNRAQVVIVREGEESETITLVPQNGTIGVSVEPARVE
jgi:membrane-associated protease RseP (regulator of RpoE activity)